MKKNLNHVPRLLPYLHLPERVCDSSEFRELWDQQANASNSICEYLESKGLEEKDVDGCLELVKKYKGIALEYIAFLFAINMSGDLKQYELYKSLDDKEG